jgi:DNA-binding NarL/FixJ family response regulator
MITILILILKSFTQWKASLEKDTYQRLLENQNILSRELTELKRTVDHQKTLAQQEFNQLREEVKSFTVNIHAPRDSKSEQSSLLTIRHMEIFELQNKGLSTEQIAAKLDRGLGEVEFILQLAGQSSQ